MDEKEPYPALLGIDWACENNVIFNLMHRKMSFEIKDLRVLTPSFRPTKGE